MELLQPLGSLLEKQYYMRSVNETMLEYPARAAVLGAGTMAPGIAAVFASAGIPTSLWARRVEAAQTATAYAAQKVEFLVSSELAGSDSAPIEAHFELASALDGAEIVVEAVSEDVSVKRRLFEAVEAKVPSSCVLASTTSGLSIDDICVEAAHPERFLVAHFWNPAHLVPLVEVLGSAAASDEMVLQVCQWLERLGKFPVRLNKFVPGFLGVRLQQAVVREAIALLENGVASASDIDAATRLSFGARFPVIGPLETSDLGGLDVVARIHEYLLADLDASSGPQEILKALIGAGHLGSKSGRGFYDWSHRNEAELLKDRDEELVYRVRKWRQSRDEVPDG